MEEGEEDDEESISEQEIFNVLRQMRKTRFWDYLTMVTSMIYSIGLVMCGMAAYFADIFIVTESNVDLGAVRYSDLQLTFNAFSLQYFNIYLCVVGLLWLAWLAMDIHFYICRMKVQTMTKSITLKRLMKASLMTKYLDKLLKQMTMERDEEGNLVVSVAVELGTRVARRVRELPEYYGFSTGRHAGSFFLKIGAGLFCLGHLFHVTMILAKQVSFFSEHDTNCR